METMQLVRNYRVVQKVSHRQFFEKVVLKIANEIRFFRKVKE